MFKITSLTPAVRACFERSEKHVTVTAVDMCIIRNPQSCT